MGIIKTDPIENINDVTSTRKKLVAKYDVNDPQGVVGNTLVDLSGNGNDGIMTNVGIVTDAELGKNVLFFDNPINTSGKCVSFITFKTAIVPVRHYMKFNMKPIVGSQLTLFQTLNVSYNSRETGIGFKVPTTTSGGEYGFLYESYYDQGAGSSPGNNTVISTRNIPAGGKTWVPVDIVNNALVDEKLIIRGYKDAVTEVVATSKNVFKGHSQRFTLGAPYNTDQAYYGFRGYLSTVEIYDLDAPMIHLISDSKRKLYTIQNSELVTLNITLDATDAELKEAIKTKGFKDTAQLILLMKSPSWDMNKFSLVTYDVVG